MPVKCPTPTQQQIDALRDRFVAKYEQSPPADPFHPVDIDRVKNDDLWCTRFLEMYDLDMDLSFDKLWSTCAWRKQFGANDLSEKNIRMDYMEGGAVFSHNKDLDGCPLLIFKTKVHQKGTKDMDEVMRIVVYWIERLQRETHLTKITVFFDMAGTGLSNMDLDFVKRIIETFKQYYPNALNYILVFEMAWILNAAFNIIKGILPAKALEILKMIGKKDVNTYIDKDNCLTSWGGNDSYEFKFVPESAPNKPMPAAAKANGTVPNGTAEQQNGQDKKGRSSVHFANSSPTRVPPMTEIGDHHTPQGQDMLRLLPNEFITFTRGENNESFVDITCISKYPVTYKIQTTSPEKFRVRPRCGVLTQGETITVSIILKPEQCLSDGMRDKFLVMAQPVPSGVELTQQMAEVWKAKPSNRSDVEQHRLCCIYKGEENKQNGVGVQPHHNLSTRQSEEKANYKGSDIQSQQGKLEQQLHFTQILQWITLALMLLLAIAVAYLLKLQMYDTQSSIGDIGSQASDIYCDREQRSL